MKKTMRLMLLMLLCMGSMYAFGQSKRTVSGTVKDSTGNGLPGVSVALKGGKTLSVSDPQGNFKVSVPVDGGTLVFTSIGYNTQEAEIGSKEFISISMLSSSSTLNEVVVTGFGARASTRKLTYSVAQVKGDEVARAGTTNIVNSLQGKVAGVMINQGAGGPSSSSRIRIRGNASFSGNTMPLFVVDGVLIQPNASGADSWGDGRDFGNALKNLNPDDYESITVLKGSAASAIYGSQGLNGVILITTKKGRQRKGLGVVVSQQTNIDKAYKLPDFQNEYGGGYDPFFKSQDAQGYDIVDPDNGPYYSFGPKLDGHMVHDADGRIVPYKANNLLDLFRTGHTYNTSVALEGGSDRTTFRFSYSNLNNNSVMENNYFKRNTFTLRATQKLGSFITVDANATYVNSNTLNPILQGGNSNPLFRFAYSNSRNYDIDYYKNHYIDSVNGGSIGGNGNPTGNPYTRNSMTSVFWNYYQNKTYQKEENLRSGIDVTATITPWLSLLVRGNYNNLTTTQTTQNRGQSKGYLGSSASYSQALTTNSYYRLQALLTGTKQIGNNLDLNLTFGGETQRGLGGKSNTVGTANGLKIADIFTLSNSVDPLTSSGYTTGNERLDALYLYGDISWKDMLTLSFSGRNDWSSTLTYPNGSGKYTYFYPSVGAAWTFSEMLKENKSFGFLSYGKLRASLGYTGKGTNIFTTSTGLGYSLNGNYTNVDGSLIPRYGLSSLVLGNQNLKNLLAREFEVGTELKFLNGRLGIDFTWYKKNTTNEVIQLSATPESGLSGRIINSGNLQNQGIEVLLTGTPVRSKNFQWNTTFNFTRNRNKVIDIDAKDGINTYSLDLAFGADVSSVAAVGKQFGTITTGYAYARETDKSSKNFGQKLLKQNGTYWRSGDYGQGSQDLGSMMENFLLSNTNDFSYKNFNLFVQVDAKVGGMMASATHQYGSEYGSFKSTLYGRDAAHGGVQFVDENGVTRNDGVIPEGVFGANTVINGTDVSGMTYADAVAKGLSKPMKAADYYEGIASWGTGIREYSVFENSWVSLREVSLGYNIPKKFTDKIKFQSLRVSLVARNFLYLYNSAKDNINPESIFASRPGAFAEYGGLPFIRTYGFMINAGL